MLPYASQPPTSQGVNRNQLAQDFQKADKDRSGQITATELQECLSQGKWVPFNPETIRLIIGMFDRDGSGTISFDEFYSLHCYITQWHTTFQMYDRDRSQSIDKRELQTALMSFGYKLTDRFYNILISRFDRSYGGVVKFDDFIQLCVVLQTVSQAFQQRDTDHDGWIRINYEDFLIMVFSIRM